MSDHLAPGAAHARRPDRTDDDALPVAPSDSAAAPAPWGRSIAEGVATGLGVGFGLFMLAAAPIFMIASLDANGQNRSIVRTGLLQIALPVSALVAVVIAVVVARWRRRGGAWTWPSPGGWV